MKIALHSPALHLVAMLACMANLEAGTFRHQVNPALQSSDPDVTGPIPSPDGSTVYFEGEYLDDQFGVWYSVPAAGGAATLLTTDGPWGDTSVTPDGAYLIGEDGDDLVAISTATGSRTVLASLDSTADWKISPDSQWVVYETSEDALLVVPVTGGAPVVITPSAGTHPYVDKWDFMPDSSAVVFLYQADSPGDSTLYAYPLPTGSPLVQLSASGATSLSDFAVAPDSSRIVFDQSIFPIGVKLYSIKADGTSYMTISDSMFQCDGLIVSGDSTAVYWVEGYPEEIRKTSLTSNTDTSLITGGSITPWSSSSNNLIKLSADGSTLVFFGDDGTRKDLYSLATGGGTPIRINAASVGSPSPEYSYSADSFEILPNSRRVVYLCDEDNSGTVDLMCGKLDGSGSTHLSRDSLSGDDLAAGFSSGGIGYVAHVLPDSSYVIYTNDELLAERNEVFAIHPDGTGRTTLNAALSTDSSVSEVGVSEDDNLLVYTGDHNGDRGTELWVVTLPGFSASQPVDLADVPLDAGSLAMPDTTGALFYSAFQDSPTHREIYSVAYNSGTPVKVNNPLPTGNHVISDIYPAPGGALAIYSLYDDGFGYRSYLGAADGSGISLLANDEVTSVKFTSDGNYAFFRAQSKGTPGEYSVYRKTLPSGSLVEISPAGFDVTAFDLSPDESIIVLQGEITSGVMDLYSIASSGGSASKLTPTLVTNGDVLDFRVSADSSTVVFIADAVTDGTCMLFSVPIGGGTATVLESGSGSMDVTTAEISQDVTRVVFRGDLGTTDVFELYSIPIGGGTRIKLNSTLIAGGDVDSFEITSDSQYVIYQGDGDTLDVSEIYSAKVDGSSTVKLNGPLVSGGEVSSFALSSDGTWVAYLGDQNTDGMSELFHVPASGGSSTRLHGAYASTRDVSYDYQIVGSDRVIFRADHGGSDDQIRLFCTKVPDFITNRLDNNSLSAGDVSSFLASPDGGYVAYLADQTIDGGLDVHVVYGVPDMTPVPNQLGLINLPIGPIPLTVTDLETPASNLTVTAVSSSPTLLPDGGIAVWGSGSARSLTLTPNAGQWGLATVTITTNDGVHQAQTTFEVRIIPDPNDPPSGLNLAPGAVAENAPVGTTVGTLSTLDPDPWDTHTYSLVGGATAEFAISGDKLVTNNIFDYETTTSYNLIIRTTDFVGAYRDQNFIINVTDLSGMPVDFTRVGQMNQRCYLSDLEFTGHFTLLDGPSLERIRIESAPTNGQLVLRFEEELIDGSVAGPQAIAAGDMNGDGMTDMVVAGSSGGSHVLVWYEQTAGLPKWPVPAGIHPIDVGTPIGHINDVALADLDRDGDLDVTASCGTPNNTVYLYRNMGGSPPVFVRSILTSLANNPVSLAVAKIDGDTEWDIVVGSSGDNTVRTFRRNGAIPGLIYFPVDVASTTENGVADIAAADIDKNGVTDIVCANRTMGEVVWLKNNGGSPPTFTRTIANSFMAGASSVAVADINKDGNPDIVGTSGIGNRVNWLRHNGSSSPLFTLEVVASTFNAPEEVITGDLDGDADQDLIVLSAVDGKVVMFENSGTSTPSFVRTDIDRSCAGASCVVARDLNGDTRLDLATGSFMDSDLSWYPNFILVRAGMEIDIDEAQKLVYRPNPGFVGPDSFDWSGHDGVQWSFDSATLTFSIYGIEYWNWLIANFTAPVINNPSKRSTVWGSSADADGDGVINIQEYALNGDPNDSGDIPQLNAVIASDGGLDHLFATYPLRKSEASLRYTLEVSSDLTTWNSGALYLNHITPDTVIDAFFDSVTYKVLDDVASEPKQFVRLRINWLLD